VTTPEAAPTVDSPYLTIEMLGAYLHHSVHTVRFWHKKKILPPPFKPRGKLLWHKDEIDRWMVDRRDRTAAKAYHRVQSAQVPLMRRQA
jgi:predicted site-specific integrase-resolvase